MLSELHVRDFALVDRVDMTFAPGLNLLTGETGAGKSIIIDAISMVLGGRAPASEYVRQGKDKAIVDAVFDLGTMSTEVKEKLLELGIDDEDGIIVITRELMRSGNRTQCRINGRPVPVNLLREVGGMLIDIHSQNEQQSLLVSDRHVDILDAWCGQDVTDLRSTVADFVSELSVIKTEHDILNANVKENIRLAELYQFQVTEIDSAVLRDGEEEELLTERVRLGNSERLSTASLEAREKLSSTVESAAALDQLNAALSMLQHVTQYDDALAPAIEALEGAVSLTEDATAYLRDYPERLQFDPEHLDEIEARLDKIRTLKRKYGDTIQEIMDFGESVRAKLEAAETSEQRMQDLAQRARITQEKLSLASTSLTNKRCAMAIKFTELISRELADLGMLQTRFDIKIEQQPTARKGADKIEFVLSPNPGEPLKSLVKIASGGEMSRVMLAIKSILVHSGSMPTMIFDEIDIGVGGITGDVIASKLQSLSMDAQILCITHLPQIASRKGKHFSVKKYQEGEKTIVTVVELDEENRVNEIARMLAGVRRTDVVVKHAREMLA